MSKWYTFIYGQMKQLGSICIKHCIALFYLEVRIRPIFRIHFSNVVALAEKDRSKRKPCACCLSTLISAGIKTPFLPQPKCTVLKLPHVVRVYSKVVAHNGDVCCLCGRNLFTVNIPHSPNSNMHSECETTTYSAATAMTTSVVLHLLGASAASLCSAARKPQPPGHSLALRPAKE